MQFFIVYFSWQCYLIKHFGSYNFFDNHKLSRHEKDDNHTLWSPTKLISINWIFVNKFIRAANAPAVIKPNTP